MCRQVFPADNHTHLQSISSDNFTATVRVQNDEFSGLHGAKMLMVGGDFRLRSVKETADVFLPLNNLAEAGFRSQSVQLSSQMLATGFLNVSNASAFVPPLGLKAVKRKQTFMLRSYSAPDGKHLPAWSKYSDSVSPPLQCKALPLRKTDVTHNHFVAVANNTRASDPASTKGCFVKLSHLRLIAPPANHSYTVVTAKWSVHLQLQLPDASELTSEERGVQVIMDAIGLFRFEYNTEQQQIHVWLDMSSEEVCLSSVLQSKSSCGTTSNNNLLPICHLRRLICRNWSLPLATSIKTSTLYKPRGLVMLPLLCWHFVGQVQALRSVYKECCSLVL